MENLTISESVAKKLIKDIINSEISEHESNLVHIKECIIEIFNKPLNSIDDAYITRKYIKYCTKFWLIEVKEILKEIVNIGESEVIVNFINSLGKIESLSNVHYYFKRGEYYNLILEHYQLLSKEDELINQFKNMCLEEILTHNKSLGKELDFIETLTNFINTCQNFKSINTQLNFKGFFFDRFSYGELLEKIMELKVKNCDENFLALQEATKRLQEEKVLYFKKVLKELIGGYLKPPTIKEAEVDGRLVIEVIGKDVDISEILEDVEDMLLENEEIEEVRFISDGVIHVNEDLENECWHGKNVLISTNYLIIYDEVNWDVSGEDNEHEYSEDAGTEEDGHGRSGAHGYAGESGGNVVIIAENVKHLNNFKIISNGGNGSKGQDGGKGKDGEDGNCMGLSEFMDKFPTVANFKGGEGRTEKRLMHTLVNINHDILKSSIVWYKDSYFSTLKDLIEHLGGIISNNNSTAYHASEVACETGESFSDVYVDYDRLAENMYIKVTTNKGNVIDFSFERGGGFTSRQGCLLYCGSPGLPGGQGGKYGLGGEGGKPGEIIAINKEGSAEYKITTETNQGENGERGKGGIYGKIGRHGTSIGYLDHKYWREPKYRYGSIYVTNFYTSDNSPSDRIWCPKFKEYMSFEYRSRDYYTKTYDEKRNTEENDDREHQARPTKKKTISTKKVIANYSQYFSSQQENTLSSLHRLRDDLEKLQQQSLEVISEKQKGDKKIQLGIKRNISSSSKFQKKKNSSISCNKIIIKNIDIKQVLNNLKLEPKVWDDWLQLKRVELTQLELDEVFEIIRKDTGDVISNKMQDIESLLNDKYRLIRLQMIVDQGSPEILNNETNQNKYNILHEILGNFNQYLFSVDKVLKNKFCEFCKKELRNSEFLRRSLRIFLLEARGTKQPHACIKKYLDEYQNIMKNHERDFNKFKKEVSQHANLLDLWFKSFRDESALISFEKELEKYELSVFYKSLMEQFEQGFDWNKFFEDKNVVEYYFNVIKEKGPLSLSYRELLACIYDVNVKVYIQNGGFYLQDDHNYICNQSIHVLYQNNEFIPLILDGDYLKLEQTRKYENDKYLKVLEEELGEKIDKYYKSNDEECINGIVEFFPENTRKSIRERLEKLAYLNFTGILPLLLMRFSIGGNHVSAEELEFLISSILSSVVRDKNELNIFCWIVVAFPQKFWSDELVLINIENYLRKLLPNKPQIREYLSKIVNKNILLLLQIKLNQTSSILLECLVETLRLLSNISDEVISNLERLGLSEWSYALKEKYWTSKLLKLVNWEENTNHLGEASYYLLSLENAFGTDVMETFIIVLQKKTNLSPETLKQILYNFYSEKWNFGETELKALKLYSIDNWMSFMKKKFTADENERRVGQLLELIKGNSNTSNGIADKLGKIKYYIENFCTDEYKIGEKLISEFNEDDIKNWVNKVVLNCGEKFRNELLMIIDRAVELKKGFRLRDTQKLTILALLTNDRSLAQVSTGEGKSLIVVALAIIKAFGAQKVHVITSNSVLTKRDAHIFKDIYSLFSITVSHNCNEDIASRKDAYSGHQVIYGDLTNFQRDYLLDKFYGKNILGDHTFTNVIVDEVDSLLLDKGNNMLYLSHNLTAFDKLESVYVYIWQRINGPALSNEEISFAFDTKRIKEAVLYQLYGVIKKEDIMELYSELSEEQRDVIWDGLIKAKLLDDDGRLLKENIRYELNKPEFIQYKDSLTYLLKQCINRDKFINVPNYLKPFIELHLDSWIESAKLALFLKAGEDYVVDVDRTGTSRDRNPNITIIDVDTGTDESNSQWDEALHQFLQLKHGCKLSLQTLKAVFISNVTFFKMYKNLFGLTGTLGSQSERNLLKDVHNVDYVTIPTAKSKKFREFKPILCKTKMEWINRICNEVNDLIENEQRSILIICKTGNDVDTLHEAFGGSSAKHVQTYKRDYEDFDIPQTNNKLKQGQIIIATNLAGRGTDIVITEALNKAGGLHVCLTYLPKNIRIEQQAFGRAARCGDKGSGQLIILEAQGQEYSNSKILDLKKTIAGEELHRLSEIKKYYETHITIEERCFKKFKEQYEKLNEMLRNENEELKENLLQSCLDKWAFWLDKNSKRLNDISDEKSEKDFNKLLEEFISGLKKLEANDFDDYPAWVDGNTSRMIKLGQYFFNKKENERAVRMFDKVIKQEPYFCEAAEYYNAFATFKLIDWEKMTEEDQGIYERFQKELKKTKKLFEERVQYLTTASGIITAFKKYNDEGFIQINAYEEQQQSLINLYNMFLQTIDGVFGHPITPETFMNYEIDEELAEIIYEGLIRESILNKPTVATDFLQDEVKDISIGFGVLPETLSNFLLKYKGKSINKIDEFQKVLKKEIQLPSRQEFWKALIKQTILYEEIKYVVLDIEKLEKLDPLFLGTLNSSVNKHKLKKQTFKCGDDEIFFSTELMQQNCNDIFKKSDFIKTFGKDKYDFFKKKAVVSFNKKAKIKLKNARFSCYDSITINDFTRVDITENEGNLILAQLIQQEVINWSQSINAFVLKIKFDEIVKIKLPSCPIYESAVKNLLRSCFAYRIALQKIEMKKFNLELPMKPHKSLFLELFTQKIIKPATITIKNKDFERENCILENHRIAGHIIINASVGPRMFGESMQVSYSRVERAIIKILDNRLLKSNEDTIKSIASILELSRSPLETLKVPDSKLTPLTGFGGNSEVANIEEFEIFHLNALDQLLQFEEKKWTRIMLLQTTGVVIMGLAQIAIGAAIQLFSAGVGTHVGAAFINEGVSDLFYATGALYSGYFSWKDYKQHKIQSIMFTALTVGVGAHFSEGTKLSRYGHKLAGPNFEYAGKKISETAGKKLIKIAGGKVIAKEFAKHIATKAIEGVTFGLANAAIEQIIKNNLLTLCHGIATRILANIERVVKTHNITTTLEKAFKILGEKDAKNLIDDLKNIVFSEKSYAKELMCFASKIFGSVSSGIAEGYSIMQKSDSNYKNCSLLICKIIGGLATPANILIENHDITHSYLDKLNNKINNKLEQQKIQKVSYRERDLHKFRDEEIEKLKSFLREKAKQTVQEHIVSPILNEGANRFLRYVGKKIKENHQSEKEFEYTKQFEELKEKYHDEQSKTSSQTEGENHLTKQYHESLLKLMIKTRDPKLFASIVRERIPMDLTCVDASLRVIQNILKQRGINIPSLTIIVEGDNGMKQKFPFGEDGVEGKIIKLQLKDNHFQLCGDGSRNNSSNNNCLYDIISNAIPEMSNISAQNFRTMIADIIETDKNIQDHIRQGRHAFSMRLGVFGGACSPKISTLNAKAENESPYQHSNDRGNWYFDGNKDVDMRKTGNLTNEELNIQRAEAYNEAVAKMKEHFSTFSKGVVQIGPELFQTTKEDHILCTDAGGKVVIGLYPTEIKAIIEITLKDRTKAKYELHINLDNPVITSELQGPHGPHIGYEIVRLDKESPKGISGHILINSPKNSTLPDRARGEETKRFEGTRYFYIPPTRLFYPPRRINASLQRTDVKCERDIPQTNLKDRYPSTDF